MEQELTLRAANITTLGEFLPWDYDKYTRQQVPDASATDQQRGPSVLFNDQQRGSDVLFTNQQRGSGNGNTRKRKAMDDDNRDTFAPFRVPRRILGRHFPLTKTGYKYLSIGIGLNLPSRVEIALGDVQSREIVLTFKIWKNILDIRDVIFRFFDRNEEGVDTPKPIRFDYLTLRFSTLNNLRVLRMEAGLQRLAMTRNTVRNMFAMEFSVNHIFQSLNKVTTIVDAKFSRFLAIVGDTKDPAIAQTTLRDNPSFDKDDRIDGELFAQMFI